MANGSKSEDLKLANTLSNLDTNGAVPDKWISHLNLCDPQTEESPIGDRVGSGEPGLNSGRWLLNNGSTPSYEFHKDAGDMANSHSRFGGGAADKLFPSCETSSFGDSNAASDTKHRDDLEKEREEMEKTRVQEVIKKCMEYLETCDNHPEDLPFEERMDSTVLHVTSDTFLNITATDAFANDAGDPMARYLRFGCAAENLKSPFEARFN